MIVAILVVLSVELLSPIPSSGAQGCVVAPTRLNLEDVKAGQEYERWVYAKYYDTADNSATLVLKLSASDSISSWVKFYDESSDLTGPINSLKLRSSTDDWVPILVKFKIPEDRPVGTYSGILYLDFWPPEGTVIGYQGKTAVTINVTDGGTAESGGSGGLEWWWIAAPVAALAVVAGVGVLVVRPRLKPARK